MKFPREKNTCLVLQKPLLYMMLLLNSLTLVYKQNKNNYFILISQQDRLDAFLQITITFVTHTRYNFKCQKNNHLSKYAVLFANLERNISNTTGNLEGTSTKNQLLGLQSLINYNEIIDY